MRRLFSILVFVGATAPLMAQQAAPPMTPPAGAPPAIQRPTAPPAQGRTPPPPGVQAPRPGQTAPALPGLQTSGSNWQNIKLEVSIADSVNVDTSARKTVTMLIADGRNGQVRSMGGSDGLINIDARPTLHRDGRIFLQLTMEYKPEFQQQVGQSNPNVRLTTFSESLALMLQDGLPIVASESSDPRSDRKVTVTLRASVQK